MLRVVTLNWQNYLGRGIEYTNVLHDSVMRNLPEGFPGTFTVFTDKMEAGYAPGIDVRALSNPELEGWYNKLSLFRDGYFKDGDRILFLDLDTVITGPLDAIAAYDGPFAILRDFFRPDGLQSSVMSWPANTQGHIWNHYKAHGYPKIDGGDQAWIEKCFEAKPDIWQDMFPGDFCSYKVSARRGVPKGAKVCVFHGEPRPHQVTEDWVPLVWKVGGGTSASMVVEANTSFEVVSQQIRSALARSVPDIEYADSHDRTALICAGGPSLSDDVGYIGLLLNGPADLFTVNGSYQYMASRGHISDYHVMVDARPENLVFVPERTTAKQLYSSQCHPSVLDAASNLTIWHPYFDGVTDVLGDTEAAMIGGGTTAGLKAAVIAYTLGYRKIHLFGFDSCYQDDDNHAYPQPMNDGERIIDATYEGKSFRCAPWMVTQAEDFIVLAPELIGMGCELIVHGRGFIPHIADVMARTTSVPAAELRAQAILSKIDGMKNPKGVEVGVFTGELSKRLLAKRPDLKLILVDSWAAQHDPQYADSGDFHASLSQEDQDRFARHTEAVVSFARDRAVIVRKPSVEAAQAIDDESLDFAFIDADHSYEGCKADLHAWYSKVRPGGVFSGHDYENTDYPGFGVTKAVTEFAVSHNLHIELGENLTWFARKPT